MKGLNLRRVRPRCLTRVNPVSAKAKTLLAQTFGILSSFGFDGDGASDRVERERERDVWTRSLLVWKSPTVLDILGSMYGAIHISVVHSASRL